MQQAAQVFKLHALGRTRGPVRVAVVHIAVAVHRDRGVSLSDSDCRVAAGRLVVGVAVKRPVGGAAGYVGETGPQVQQAAQVFKLQALGRTRGPVRVAVVHVAVAAHRDRGVSLSDSDCRVAAGRLVVGVAGKRPVGGTAGYVGESGPQVQQAAQVFKLHALGRTRGPVRVAVVHTRVAADVD